MVAHKVHLGKLKKKLKNTVLKLMKHISLFINWIKNGFTVSHGGLVV